MTSNRDTMTLEKVKNPDGVTVTLYMRLGELKGK